MHLARFEGRADHAVEPGLGGAGSVVHDHFVQRAFDEQVFTHTLFAGGGELGHSDEQGARAVGTGKAGQSAFHHGHGSGGMQVAHIDIKVGEHGHSLLHGIRDVVQFEVEEDLVTARLDLAHDGRAFGVVEFHADLHKGLFFGEEVEKIHDFLLAAEVEGDHNVFLELAHQ